MSEAEPMTDRGDELLPCPWCGVKGFMYHSPEGWKASCSKCNCETNPGLMFETKEIAIAEWNKRAPTPPSDDLRAAMEALRPYTSGPWHLKVVGDVLAAWDRQQGDWG